MITIHKNDLTLGLKTFSFPAGERGVKLDISNLRYLYEKANHQTIVARLHNGDDVMELLMVVDALRAFDKTPVHLFLPYLNYGRQDRRCVAGESFSVKVFGKLINSLGLDKVTIVDPHSEVSVAVLDNPTVITQFDVINKFQALTEWVFNNQAELVSPDAGAVKKVVEVAKYYSRSDFVRCDKRRNLATGEIIETVVHADESMVRERNLLIVDDLGDGMKTYIEMAKVLKAKGAAKIGCYVTHGIFSKGTKCVFESGITDLFSTNSFFSTWPGGVDGVTTLNLEGAFKL